VTSPRSRKAALDLALDRGLLGPEGGDLGAEDLGIYVRRGRLDLETMHLLEREAELLVTGRYPEYGDEPTALARHDPPQPLVNRLGLYPWADWSRFRPEVFLGEGGMGRVFRVHDVRLKRRVALKFFRMAMEGVAQAYLREAQSQARIDHPHVAKVFEAGAEDGIPFLSMQFINGPTLAKAAAGLDLRDKVEIIRQAALGVHAAHRLGIVHRDLKPGNIMLERDDHGDWKAFVMDFGLARDLTDMPSGATALMGTPSYMSPEQIEGPSVLVGPCTDIYALGVTLYHLLAGQLPFQGTGQVEVMRKIMEHDAPTLRQVDPELPKELEAVVQKCMERDVLTRYDTALELAEELQRWLDGKPVLASPVSRSRQLLRRVRRHRVAAIGLAAVLLLGGGWAATALAQRARARDLGRQVEARNAEMASLRQEIEALRGQQAEERRRAESLQRLVAAAPTPAARQEAEAQLQASRTREEALARQVEAALRKAPVLGLSPAEAAKGTAPGETLRPPEGEPRPAVPGTPRLEGAPLAVDPELPAPTPPRMVKQAPVQAPSRLRAGQPNPFRQAGPSVLLRVKLDAAGQPETITILEGVPGPWGYNEAAIEAVRRSTYAPATREGRPVPGTLDVRVNFPRTGA
jgi:TonB family protein